MVLNGLGEGRVVAARGGVGGCHLRSPRSGRRQRCGVVFHSGQKMVTSAQKWSLQRAVGDAKGEWRGEKAAPVSGSMV